MTNMQTDLTAVSYRLLSIYIHLFKGSTCQYVLKLFVRSLLDCKPWYNNLQSGTQFLEKVDCLYTAVYTLAVDSVCLYSSHLCLRLTTPETRIMLPKNFIMLNGILSSLLRLFRLIKS